MKYTKAPLTFQDQVNLLTTRGLLDNSSIMEKRLASVNYYRLTGYLHPYRIAGSDNYLPGTQFDTIWNHYAFDRRLRLLVMDAIERIEIAVRSQLAYHHSHTYNDPFAYALTPASLPDCTGNDNRHSELLGRILSETGRSKDLFVDSFKTKYGDSHPVLPLWMAVEIMSFGTMQRFYRGASHSVQQKVASHLGMPAVVLDSWLHTLSIVRNICAHHGRLWNKVLGVKPKIPLQKDYPDWHTPYTVPRDRVFAILTICRYCLRIIAPQSRWPAHVTQLLNDFPGVPIAQMGFPANWQNSPLWK